jgi:hypothetical protein
MKMNRKFVVAKRKQKSKQTKKLVTAKQEGNLKPPPYKLKPPPYKLKPPLSTPKRMEDLKHAWLTFPLSTCKSCGVKGHVANECHLCINGQRIRCGEIPYHKPGDKPLTRKEH